MLNILKEIILDFQEGPLNTGVSRNLEISSVPGKATVCIGVRRCGKSTFMLQHIRKLLDKGVNIHNILYLNFFDDRLHALKYDGLSIILEAYFSLYPDKKNSEKIYCFFDEIQVIPNWEPFVDRVLRAENCEVYITGSSAQMLSREIATEMRGRALSWELFPFSFREFLKFKGLETNAPFSTKKRFLIQKAFDEYWQSGGFPEVAGLDKALRIKIHQEYFNAMLFRDLIERHNISHPKAIIDLTHWLINNIASLYSINSLTRYLKSLGHKTPKSAVSEYISWLEDAFAFFTVRIFDASLSRVNSNPKKIYCVDHSMVTSLSSGILVNKGHLLENMVFTALRRITSDIFYYKTNGGKEVDFIIRQTDHSLKLIQVSESIAAPQTRQREVAALTEAMEELNVNGTIVTRSTDEQIKIGDRVINIVPIYRFLLDITNCETAKLNLTHLILLC